MILGVLGDKAVQGLKELHQTMLADAAKSAKGDEAVQSLKELQLYSVQLRKCKRPQ